MVAEDEVPEIPVAAALAVVVVVLVGARDNSRERLAGLTREREVARYRAQKFTRRRPSSNVISNRIEHSLPVAMVRREAIAKPTQIGKYGLWYDRATFVRQRECQRKNISSVFLDLPAIHWLSGFFPGC